jgi:hypothetical protein
MSSSPSTARDETFERFTVQFAAGSEIIIGDPVEIRYQGVTHSPAGTILGPIDPSKYWVRISMRGVISRPSAFVLTDEDTPSQMEFETNGLIFVQVFAPMIAVNGFAQGLLLAELAQAIFRRAETASGVIFNNVRIVELDDDTKSYRWNVIAEYEFSEVY